MSGEPLQRALAHFAQRKNATLDIPEWGVTVHYCVLNLMERQAMIGGSSRPEDLAFRMAKLVAEKAKDADGKPLFGEPTPELIRQIQHEMDPVIIDRIAVAIVGRGEEPAKNS